MKKILLGTVAAAALGMAAAPASAADLAARPYTKAPPPMVAPIYDWSGFYIGINGGYAWGRSNWTNSATGATTGDFNLIGAMFLPFGMASADDGPLVWLVGMAA